MNEGSDTFKRITNNDIWEKLVSIENHVITTNGRVTKSEEKIERLEEKSIGLMISNNPFKCILITISILGLFVSDFRQPAINFLFGFF